MAAIAAILILGACSARPGEPRGPSPVQAVVSGEWRDVDAAVHAASIRTEMAVVHALAQGPDRWVYTLRTAGGEPVRAEIRRVSPGDDPRSVSDIVILCRVGRLGGPAREGAFIDAFGHRLARLTGVEARRLGR